LFFNIKTVITVTVSAMQKPFFRGPLFKTLAIGTQMFGRNFMQFYEVLDRNHPF
jgi:hypothetical protein